MNVFVTLKIGSGKFENKALYINICFVSCESNSSWKASTATATATVTATATATSTATAIAAAGWMDG